MDMLILMIAGVMGIMVGTQLDKKDIKESDPMVIDKEVYRCGKIDLDACPIHIKPKSKKK